MAKFTKATATAAPGEGPFEGQKLYRLGSIREAFFSDLGEDALRRLLTAVPRIKFNRRVVAWLGRDLNAFLASKTSRAG